MCQGIGAFAMSFGLFGAVSRRRTVELHRSQGCEVAARCVSCRIVKQTDFESQPTDVHTHSTLAFCVPNPSGASSHLTVAKEFSRGLFRGEQAVVEGSVVQLNYLPSDPLDSMTVW